MSLKQLLEDPAYQSLSIEERKLLLKKLQAEYEESIKQQAAETAAHWQQQLKKVAIGAAVGIAVLAAVQWFLSKKKKQKHPTLPPESLAQQAVQMPIYTPMPKQKKAWHYFWDYLQKEAGHLLAHELSKQIRKFAEQTIHPKTNGHGVSQNTSPSERGAESPGSTY
ncbi:negative regulator of sigma E activity [Thermonema lapsum]|uniref:Negative regulator of sigma E activity n=1 Tax=Thermonema lapsum TaxID=28195 RepID=A0A846MPN9_9BACT|nr:hypothetical protein [Thermonema lapsum]NIK73429.1 negative regulator of sigma E activity [Thermonema lapsum]